MIMMIGCDRIKHACTSQFLGFSQNDVTNVVETQLMHLPRENF